MAIITPIDLVMADFEIPDDDDFEDDPDDLDFEEDEDDNEQGDEPLDP